MELDQQIRECRNEVDNALATLHGRVDEFSLAIGALGKIQEDIKEMREIIDAWNNAKGFVTTIKFLSAFIKWAAIVGGAVGVLWYFLKFGHFPDQQ